MAVDLSFLNEQQRDAIYASIDKNIVLTAAAGSGKTKTLVTRTQYLLDDMQVLPEQIMLITFTNKAVNEIKERILSSCRDVSGMWIGTFHNICARIIRQFGSKLGIQNYTMLDTAGSKNLVKSIMQENNIPDSASLCTKYRKMISDKKNNLISSKQCINDPNVDKRFAFVYKKYNDTCWQNRTFDFDDLICYGILLLQNYSDVTDWFHDNIKYIMVDEAQDSNSANLSLIELIIGDNNVMLFGDENQSIYKFRNAVPEYMGQFSEFHANTQIMKLEQNYRSTKTIINGANAVISHNQNSSVKMFCENEIGEAIQLYVASDDKVEAEWISMELRTLKTCGVLDYGQCAAIARTRMQLRVLENAFKSMGIPYTVYGNQGFYQRKDVKDLLAYCNLYVNENDVDALKRVLRTLKGVGDKTIETIINTMRQDDIKPKYAIKNYVDNHKVKKIAQRSLMDAALLMSKSYDSCSDFIYDVFLDTDYKRNIQAQMAEDTDSRIETLDEFLINVKEAELDNPSFNMREITSYLLLMSESTGADKEQLNAVKIMTAHSSKGLEFDCVFVIGMEEKMFPHANSLNSGKKEDVEEERRLFYVSMTRAKKRLYITRCGQRRNDGSIILCKQSRFINEIPKELVNKRFF